MFPAFLSGFAGRPPLAAAAAAAATALALAACGGDDDGAAEPRQPAATYSYVAFQSTDPVAPLVIPARLGVPTSGQTRHPAVVIAHGSSGIDTRGSYHAERLNRAGIATLEIDMWSPRGVGSGTAGRPRTVGETLPDAFGGLRMLAADSRIDAQRIGIMGFSWGGVVSMLAATTPYNMRYAPAGLRFAAHAPFYPVCWAYNRVPGYEFASLTGAPVLIQTGALDDYDDDPDACPNVAAALPAPARALVSTVVYPDVHHAWDQLEPAITITDPFSHKGRGGTVDIVPDAAAAERSAAETVAFFRRAFGL